MNCYEAIDVMGDAAEDRIAPHHVDGFEEHLADCPACATYYEQLRVTRSALRSLPRPKSGGAGLSSLIEAYRKKFGR